MEVHEKVTGYLEFCKYRKGLDVKTLKAYRIDLRQYFGFCKSLKPDKEKIEAYITELHKKYKPKTIKRKLASIKAFYAYLEEEESIDESPFKKIKIKIKKQVTLPRIISRRDIERLLNYMYNKKHNRLSKSYKYWIRDLSVIEVLFATGIRISELSHIQEDSIDLVSGVIRIKGKGNKERYVQVVDENILFILNKYYMLNMHAIHSSGFFFINNRGKRYTEQSIRLMIKKYTKECNINQNITPHMFRHSFATYLIEEGADISCVQEILGHSSIKTTRIYVHVSRKMQTEILRKMHPRNKMSISTAA